jgi:hypothetical protein
LQRLVFACQRRPCGGLNEVAEDDAAWCKFWVSSRFKFSTNDANNYSLSHSAFSR